MTVRKPFLHTLFWLIITSLCLLAIGSLQARSRYLTRGITPLPGPIAHAGVQPGVNVRLDQYNAAALDTTLSTIAQTELTWLKQPFFYSDNFDWVTSDRIVNAVSQHPTLTLVPLLDGDPAVDFAAPDIDRYAEWTAAFATRYADSIDHYIIWDEPNLTSHWGNEKVNPDVYAALLTAANRAIKQADPTAVIVAAPLAPTTEYQDSVNMAEHLYLQRLYEAGAEFDVAAGKPYGFDHAPDDRRVDPDLLNFSRIILLREVMERNGDSNKALWAGNFGWNYLPAAWTGAPSAWGEVTQAQQIDYTQEAFGRAQQEWHWMGVMFLENWQPIEPADHPKWGFSVADNKEITAVTTNSQAFVFPGFHTPDPASSAQTWTGDWTFADGIGADSSEKYVENGDIRDTMTLQFVGTEIGIRVRRADFRSRLYVTVDGKPANARPSDEAGTHVVLDAADPALDYLTIEPIATGLDNSLHTLEITAHRGWGQYAINGFSVGYMPPTHPAWLVPLLIAIGVGALALAINAARQVQWTARWRQRQTRFNGRAKSLQLTILTAMAAVLTISGYLTWWTNTGNIFRRLGDIQQVTITAFAASIFYASPWFIVYVLALLALVVLVSFRPLHGIALVAFAIPLYARPGIFTTGDGFQKAIVGYPFSPVEILIWIALAAFFIHQLPHLKTTQTRGYLAIILAFAAFVCEQFDLLGSAWWLATAIIPVLLWLILDTWADRVRRVDYAVLALVAVAALSLLSTRYLDVARNEYWWVIVEPALCYVLVRLTLKSRAETWLLLDAFVLSGAAVALYGMAQLLFGIEAMITAEGGMMRVQSFYGSPNNVALYLGRVLPILLTVTLFGTGKRRIAYALLAALCGGIFLLTLSKGGILVGLPALLLVLLYFWVQRLGRNPMPFIVGSIVLGLVGLFVALQIPQLSARLSLTGETSFARTYLWRSSLEIIREHPFFGIGLDNFLYEYRGRYLLESAWREPNLNHPHNLLFDFATRLGLIGLAIGVWLYTAAIRATRHLHSSKFILRISFLAFLAYTLAHGLVDHVHFLVDLAFAFHLILAIIISQKREQ